MQKSHIYILLIICSLLITACSNNQISQSQTIVAAYSASWNEKDLNKMAALMHPDIQWMSVKHDTILVEISGKPELVAEMQKWFARANLPAGSLRDWSINGNYVAVTETAAWTDKSGAAQSQSSLTVYELENNLIRRVYYYPSVKN